MSFNFFYLLPNFLSLLPDVGWPFLIQYWWVMSLLKCIKLSWKWWWFSFYLQSSLVLSRNRNSRWIFFLHSVFLTLFVSSLCRDDPELDKILKERLRWGDPMAHLVKVLIINRPLLSFYFHETYDDVCFVLFAISNVTILWQLYNSFTLSLKIFRKSSSSLFYQI